MTGMRFLLPRVSLLLLHSLHSINEHVKNSAVPKKETLNMMRFGPVSMKSKWIISDQCKGNNQNNKFKKYQDFLLLLKSWKCIEIILKYLLEKSTWYKTRLVFCLPFLTLSRSPGQEPHCSLAMLFTKHYCAFFPILPYI